MLLETQYKWTLPTRNFLSSNTRHLQLATLIQKFVLQVIILELDSDIPIKLLIMNSIGIVFNIFKNFELYVKLPLYRYEASLYQASFLAIVDSLYIACFIQALSSEVFNIKISSNFITIVWIIFSVLTVKSFYNLLCSKIVNLLTTSSANSSKLLIHKIVLMNEVVRSHERLYSFNDKNDWRYLLRASIVSNIKNIFSLKAKRILDLDESEDKNLMYVEYLETFARKFPQDTSLKLMLVQMYIRKLKQYKKAIRAVMELRRQLRPSDQLQCSLLFYEAEEKMKSTSIRR